MFSCALAYVFALNMSNNKLASKILPLKYIMLLLAKIVFFVHLFKKNVPCLYKIVGNFRCEYDCFHIYSYFYH